MPSSRTLVLFDIDGTLVDCGRASGRSFSRAFQEAFGSPCPIFTPEEVSGLTDAAILMRVVQKLGLRCDDFDRRRERAFEIYARNLAADLERQPARPMAGARDAVEAARAATGCEVGLLTGSTAATARIKLESAGLEFSRFACGAFSEDGELRQALPPVARRRFAQLFGREPEVTILVGDTPRDVHAALATACEFIGVTTGPYDRRALQEAGARTIFSDLSDTQAFLAAVRVAKPPA